MLNEIIFWTAIGIVLYTYFGYGVILVLLDKLPVLKKMFPKPLNAVTAKKIEDKEYIPNVSLIVSASGESRETIKEKIKNIFELNYPKDKLEVIFAVAYDTSKDFDETIDEYYNNFLNDNTEDHFDSVEAEDYLKNKNNSYLKWYDNKLTKNEKFRFLITKDIRRKGKISQVNRTVKNASGEIIVFSDANTFFNPDSIKNITKHFSSNQVGCVAGEKRIKRSANSTSDEGEGFYWKYESLLKKLDTNLWSVVGAAGEIFAVRKEFLKNDIKENSIIEDFVLSMNIAADGYRVVYEPEAYAEEEPTSDIKSEYIRRRRITAGGFQSIVWLKKLLNPIKYGVLTFQYVSHRVLRWAVVPFLLPMIFVINLFMLDMSSPVYSVLLGSQILFYTLSLIGWFLETKRKKFKLFNIPFYFSMMNFSAYAGLKRYLLGQQKVIWERVRV